MIETLNRQALLALAAPSDLDGEALLCVYALAEWLVYVWPALLVLLWLFGGARDRHAVVAATATGLLALFGAEALSLLVVHPRPFMLEPVRNFLDQPAGSSFPSGHAAVLFGLGLSAFGLRPPALPRFSLASLLTGGVVAGARMVLGANYPLDMVGSFAIAGVAALLVHSAWGRRATVRLTGLVERVYGITDQATDSLTARGCDITSR